MLRGQNRTSGEIKVRTFRMRAGVAGARLKSKLGHFSKDLDGHPPKPEGTLRSRGQGALRAEQIIWVVNDSFKTHLGAIRILVV